MREITRRQALGVLTKAAGAAVVMSIGGPELILAEAKSPSSVLNGRLVATGIPGASGLAPVGTFLPGGPIHDNPILAAFTQPGRVLDPNRLLVGSRSNFGAPKANQDQAAGSLLSIDPRQSHVLDVPAGFDAAGDQATALGGAVQMYSAQSANWINGVYNPGAVTAGQTAVSNPLALSINNAFGRMWPANAPYGLGGPGTSSIDDPDGRPLKGAPNAVTGGVYFGDQTGRRPAQIIPGALNRGAVGTAFLGRSPDGSTKAVFAVIAADGSIVQEHTLKGLDGLAPVDTVQPLRDQHSQDFSDRHAGDAQSGDRVTPKVGAVVNYQPSIVLYVSQPFDDSLVAIELGIGGPTGDEVFVPTARRVIHSHAFNQPIDLAPVRIETEDPNWASNTTMEEGSDMYVCNRGDNSVIRLRQDGTVVSRVRVHVNGRSLGDARLNGVASSPDGSRLWVSYVGRLSGSHEGDERRQGGVIELPAF